MNWAMKTGLVLIACGALWCWRATGLDNTVVRQQSALMRLDTTDRRMGQAEGTILVLWGTLLLTGGTIHKLGERL